MSATRIRRSQRDYSMAFKLQVISEVEQGQLTYKKAQAKYGIQGKSTVLVWLRKHGTLDWKVPITMNSPEQKIKELEAKLKKLELELEEERLRRKMSEMTLDIADKQFGLGLRKKYLPKQSNHSTRKNR